MLRQRHERALVAFAQCDRAGQPVRVRELERIRRDVGAVEQHAGDRFDDARRIAETILDDRELHLRERIGDVHPEPRWYARRR
jgi:hypothetical protein